MTDAPLIEVELLVKSSTLEAPRVRSFELVHPEGQALPPVEAGAHIYVYMPNGLTRQYSLLNAPGSTDRYVVAVLKEIEGRGGSHHMHENVGDASKITISGPYNNFPLLDAERYLLIAGGIGVTPILSMAQQLAADGKDFELHYCARSPEDAAFVDWLKAQSFAERVHFHFDGGDPSKGLDVKALLDSQPVETHLYCCGPAGLMDAVKQGASGWAPERVHFESFSGVDAIGEGAAGFEVEIASTGKVLQVPDDKTVIAVLRDAGFDIESVCEEGICGTCIVGVLEGEPEHRDDILTDEEKESNELMTVCCSRAKSKRLKLDL